MESGYLEVVLSGIHLGQYGSDLNVPVPLEGMLEMLIKEGLPGRVRLSSIEPLEVSGTLIDIIRHSDGFICRHLHVPVQSGSDQILAEMQRPYRSSDVREALIGLQQEVHGIGLGCDLICGFPGETQNDFYLTEELITELQVPFVHAFPYSSRPGTKASFLRDDVPYQIKKERVRRLRSIAEKNRAEFARKQAGSTITVALESGNKSRGVMWGLTDNYLRVKINGCAGMRPGNLADVFITGSTGEALEGRPVF
jgi:threonylcarbamoyladenosine tRNA methylthiotransferase MtaB